MKASTGIAVLTISVALSCGLFACSAQDQTAESQNSNTQEQPAVETQAVGETVKTDVVSFTLERAELAIALENSGAATIGYGADGMADDAYFMPKEYNAEEDSDNPFVASKGHTLVSMTFSASNLDRTSLELDGGTAEKFIAVNYEGQTYTKDADLSDDPNAIRVRYGVQNENGAGWKDYSSSNILMGAGESNSYKCMVDIPVEIEDFQSAFQVTFNLPTSSGETQAYTYAVNS